MKTSKLTGMVTIVLAGSFLLAAIPVAAAQEQNWELTATLYGWYTDVGGESAAGSNIDWPQAKVEQQSRA